MFTPHRRLQGNRHFLSGVSLVKNEIEKVHQGCDRVHAADEEEDEFDHVCPFHCRSARGRSWNGLGRVW